MKICLPKPHKKLVNDATVPVFMQFQKYLINKTTLKRNNVSKFSIHSLLHRLKKCYLGNSNKINQNWCWFDKVVDPNKT